MVLSWGDFGPQGTCCNVWKHCWLSQLGEGTTDAWWVTGQGRCQTSFSVQDDPP